jgi:hypothetical protein
MIIDKTPEKGIFGISAGRDGREVELIEFLGDGALIDIVILRLVVVITRVDSVRGCF